MMKKESNKKTLKWIFARTKRYIPAIVCLTVISAVVSLTFIWLALISKDVLDVATGEKEGRLFTYGILLAGVVAVQVIMSAISSFLNTYTAGKLTISIRNYVFKTISKKKYAEISKYHSGDLLNRITSDVDVVVSSTVSIIPGVVSIITKIVAGIGAILILDRTLALIVLATGIIFPALGRLINKRYKYLHKQCQQTEGQARSFMQECFENIVVIKTFISEGLFVRKLNQYLDLNFRNKMKRTTMSVIAGLGLYSFFTIGYYLVLLWGADSLASGAITYGTLTAFLQLVAQLRAPLQNVSGILPQYYSALASAERILVIESDNDEKPPVSSEELQKLRSSFDSLEVNNIDFSYDSETILMNCSFVIEKGCITAITGESGSGKSTLFKIILGLYEPQGGNITINREIVLDTSLRGLFAYVPQGNLVLSGTIRDNITLCNDEISDEQVVEAAKAAEIYDFICTTPGGFDTELSERGAGLSEGQIQRISIARALLVDAPVLLLDEATSALDEKTETKLLSNIKELTNKTVIFITHRNTSLKVCDKIVHVEGKKFTTIK